MDGRDKQLLEELMRAEGLPVARRQWLIFAAQCAAVGAFVAWLIFCVLFLMIAAAR